MITQETFRLAKATADELRERGEEERAQAIDALVEAARDETVERLDMLTSREAGELVGVSGQTIKNWVKQGQLRGFRVGGRDMIPRDLDRVAGGMRNRHYGGTMAAREDVRRVHVNCTPSAYQTLEGLARSKGKTLSETLRDAIALEKYFEDTRRQGGRILVERDGEIRELIKV